MATRRSELVLRPLIPMGRVLHWLVILTLASAAFPLNPTLPEWYLRLGDASVSNAPVLLLMFLLLLLARVFQRGQETKVKEPILRLSRLWSILFGVIVPLQVVCFVWLWVGSGSQIQQQIKDTKVQMDRLERRLDATTTEAELRQVLAEANNGSMPILPQSGLAQQKQQLRQFIGFNFKRLQADLKNRRNRILSDRFPGVLRTAIGATLLCGALKSINRSAR